MLQSLQTALHRLDEPTFLNPRVFNVIKAGQAMPNVLNEKTVEVDGECFTLQHPEEVTLVPGQKVYITLNRWFYLETGEEREAREQQARAEYQRQQDEQREEERRRNAEAAAFNAQFQLPVAWTPGIKDVLSGLSEKSAGDGWNARTVVHMFLKGDLHEGRLRRQAGDFLCTGAGGSNGKQWSAQPEQTWKDSEGSMVQAKVTCQSCLRLAERWKAEVSK